MAPPQPVKRRRRNPGMWDWEDEQDVTIKPVWISMLKPDGAVAPVRVELKGKNVDLMCQVAHKEPDGSTPFIKEVTLPADGRRDPETKYFQVRRQRNGIWMDLEVALNPRKQTLTCTCQSGSTHYGHPCVDGGGAMRLLGLLKIQEDYYKAGLTAPGELASEGPQQTPPSKAASSKSPSSKASNPRKTEPSVGQRVTMDEVKRSTADLAMGVFTETEPIYFDPKRIEGAIEIEEGSRKVRIFGTRSVIGDFTATIVRPRFEAPLEVIAPAPPQARSAISLQKPAEPVSAPTPSFSGAMEPEEVPNVEPEESSWRNPKQAARFLVAGFDAAMAKGTIHAPTTEELLRGMFSLDNLTAYLDDTQPYRQAIYDMTRETKRKDGSNAPSQVERAIEELRPDLEYWNSARWNQTRGASKKDEDITEERRNMKVGHKGQHWLLTRTP